MSKIAVEFVYFTGLKREIFRNARLTGSWDADSRYSDQWSTISMEPITGEDGCPAFRIRFNSTHRKLAGRSDGE